MRSNLVRAAIALAIMFPSVAGAAQPFDAKAFQRMQAAGKTTLIHVGASWCATCRRQQPIIHQIEQEVPELVVYEVDFDTAKDVLKRLGVRYQTTLIVFRGETEIARSVGGTSPSGMRALVATGL
jgi:thioredoxin